MVEISIPQLSDGSSLIKNQGLEVQTVIIEITTIKTLERQ